MKLIIASNNENKIREIRKVFSDMDLLIRSLKDESIFIDVEEDGETIPENSYKKAKEIYEYLKERGDRDFYVLSDDSGLMVDYLNGAPGVISKRFSGEESTDEKNNTKVLTFMDGVEEDKRDAKLITVLTLIDHDGFDIQFEGILEGKITREKKGDNGFGYDPIFYVEEFKKTLAEVTIDEKNSLSHRGRALRKLREYLALRA